MTAPHNVHRASIVALVLVLGLSAGTAPAQTPPIWRESLASKATSIDYTLFGSALVQLKAGLLAVDPQTGKHLWFRADVEGHSIIPGTPFATVETQAGNALVDLESGRTLWQIETLRSAGFTTLKGFLPLVPRGLILVYGPTPESRHTLVAVKFESGEMLWKQATLYAAPPLAQKAERIRYRNYLPDTDSTIVIDAKDDGLIRLDLESGKLLWRISESELDSGGDPVTLALTANRLIFLAYARKLLAVGADEGKVLWTRKDKLPAPAFQMAPTSEGLLVRGGSPDGHHYLTLLEPATGATKWTTENTRFEGRSSFLLEDHTIVIGLKRGVATYDLATGRELTNVTLPEFSGDEAPCCLQRLNDGRLLMLSSQNLRMLDASGKLLYSVYLKAPGASFLAKLASAAVQTAIATAVGGAVGGLASAPGGYYYVPVDNSTFTRKYKSTVDVERFTYIFTEASGVDGAKFALVRIDKDRGKETGRLWFADRSPLYRLDPATGVAVVVRDDTLFAIRFEDPR